MNEYKKASHEDDPVYAMSSSNLTGSAFWYGANGTNYNSTKGEDWGRWGGTFTHFFFEALDLDKTDSQSFFYAFTNSNYYALSVIEPLNQLDQKPQKFDNLVTTWF